MDSILKLALSHGVAFNSIEWILGWLGLRTDVRASILSIPLYGFYFRALRDYPFNSIVWIQGDEDIY
jgi:hypothetical protein